MTNIQNTMCSIRCEEKPPTSNSMNIGSPTTAARPVRHVTSPINLTEIPAECSNSSSSDDDYIPHSPVSETGSSSSNDILSETLDKETDKYEECISARTAKILKQEGLYETLHDSHHPVFAEFHSHMEKATNCNVYSLVMKTIFCFALRTNKAGAYVCDGKSLTTKFNMEKIFGIENKINKYIDVYVSSNVALQTVRQLFHSIEKWCKYLEYLKTDVITNVCSVKAQLDGFRSRMALFRDRANHALQNNAKQRTLEKQHKLTKKW